MRLSPWLILAVLFAARASMGFQHQLVASTAPLLQKELGVGWDQIGLLMGAYFMAGVVIAPPAGAFGARFGARAVTLVGLALMVAGALAGAFSTSWPIHLGARVIAGAGGVLITVVMTRMVADWFASGGMATAMGIFVNAWPVGLSIALLAAPPIAIQAGLSGAFLASAAFCAVGLALIALVYGDPPRHADAAPEPAQAWPSRPAFVLTVLAAMIWGWFNAGFSMVFGFGPAMLIEQGASPLAAGSTVSIALWFTILSVPVGGFLSDRFRRPALVILVGAVASAACIALAGTNHASPALFALLGLVVGLPAGPVMALPASVLAPDERAKGMGVFYAIYYLIMVLAPVASGWLATRMGSSAPAFLTGVAFMALALASYASFLAMRARRAARG